jgi:hypothetical protein
VQAQRVDCVKPSLAAGDTFAGINVIIMNNYHNYQSCIEACLRCAALCNHCASACTKEEHIAAMARCIRLDMECAAMCYAAAQLMSMDSDRVKDICALCAVVCEECARECTQHDNEHCRECAAQCTNCADECLKMAA